MLAPIFLLLAASPTIVSTWPDGGPREIKTWDGGVLVTDTYFFTTGEKWIEFSGGVRRSWSTDGYLDGEMPVDGRGNAEGLSRKFQRDGGLVSLGAFSNGVEIGEWKTWYENGAIDSVRFYSPAGKLKTETTWTAEGWKQSEVRPGLRVEFEADGGLLRRIAGDLFESWQDGRLVEQQRGGLVLNSWGPDGGREIRNGEGSRIEYDGELGTPFRAWYSGGKRVRPR